MSARPFLRHESRALPHFWIGFRCQSPGCRNSNQTKGRSGYGKASVSRIAERRTAMKHDHILPEGWQNVESLVGSLKLQQTLTGNLMQGILDRTKDISRGSYLNHCLLVVHIMASMGIFICRSSQFCGINSVSSLCNKFLSPCTPLHGSSEHSDIAG